MKKAKKTETQKEFSILFRNVSGLSGMLALGIVLGYVSGGFLLVQILNSLVESNIFNQAYDTSAILAMYFDVRLLFVLVIFAVAFAGTMAFLSYIIKIGAGKPKGKKK
jgi:hypothetical protein